MKGTRIEGFTVRNFTGYGVYLFHADHSKVTKSEAYGNGGYGISGYHLHGIEYRDDVSHSNGEPGFYIGNSPQADAHVVHNVSYGNATGGVEGIGILLRDSMHGDVRDNTVYDNCAGIVFADTGENPTPVQHWKAEHNTSEHNNMVCAGEPGGAPPMSGLGIGILGGQQVDVQGQHRARQRRLLVPVLGRDRDARLDGDRRLGAVAQPRRAQQRPTRTPRSTSSGTEAAATTGSRTTTARRRFPRVSVRRKTAGASADGTSALAPATPSRRASAGRGAPTGRRSTRRRARASPPSTSRSRGASARSR